MAEVRRRLKTRAVGHAGTLDPFATGLLVVLVGKATRLARFAEGMEKQYQATVRFGIATNTDDSDGITVRESTPAQWPDDAAIDAALAELTGTQLQRPPVFSAKHVDGVRSYTLARRGEAVELPPVEVHVKQLVRDRWIAPDLTLSATVGRGTYVRALARDLGERLGIPAHCATLRRTATGPFNVGDALLATGVTVADLIALPDVVPNLSRYVLDEYGQREIGFGRSLEQDVPHDGFGALLGDDGRLIAVADGREGIWHPKVVMEPLS